MIKVWADSVLGEDLSPGLLLALSSYGMEKEKETETKGEKENALVSLPILTNPIMGSPPS